MSQWLQSAKATVSAGASVISFTDNKDFSSVRAGDVVMINGQIWQCASGTRPDSAGQSLVNLAAAWPYTGASNVNAFVFRTTHDLLQLTSDARKLTNITKALLAAQEDILKSTTPTINVPIGIDPATGDEEVIEVTPWQYVINTVNASLGNISAIGAMSQVQFEAIREQNKDKYAASAWVSFGNHEAGKQVNECKPGLYTSLTTPNTLLIGKAGGVGGSKTDHGVLCIAGVIFDLPLAYPIRLAQAPDGKTTYNKSTGVITNHATVAAAFNAQAADPVNIEVVINRVDMWGFEAFPQEVTPANPEIYPQGVFSGLFTSMNGIPTSDSARPASYFGFLGKKAKKVDFFALSDAQKKKVLADPKNNLYYSDDGRLIQWVLRGLEFAGAGNGDWDCVQSTDTISSLYTKNLGYAGLALVRAQGLKENPPVSGGGYPAYTGHVGSEHSQKSETGLFHAIAGSLTPDYSVAINGECYFLVCGTVNRLNQGAYHTCFNPSGTKEITDTYGDQNTSALWHNVTGTTKQQFISTAAAFDPQVVLFNSGYIGNPIAAISVRPDRRFYDGIYASGDGGVCRDMRYSAYGKTLEDFAEADHRVKNGTYRGFEKLRHTKVIAFTCSTTEVGQDYGRIPMTFAEALRVAGLLQNTQGGLFANKNMAVSLYNPTNGLVIHAASLILVEGNAHFGSYLDPQNSLAIWLGFDPSVVELHINGFKRLGLASGTIEAVTSTFCSNGQTLYAIATELKTTSVGGSFLQTDVIGNPANILATPALANGWQGSWIPDITTGAKALIRKSLSSGNIPVVFSTNNGVTWSSGSQGLNSGTNALDPINPTLQVWIVQYQAFAKQTEPAANAGVYGGNKGIGVVSTIRVNDIKEGCLLQESLIGKVNTDSAAWITSVNLIAIGLSAKGNLVPLADYASTHHKHMFDLLAPSNNSSAVKLLNYNVNINPQAFIQYAYTELKHNGTNWGDDDKVTIVDNQAIKTDLNGHTVLVGTAKLKEPIGWIKNKV